MKKAAIFCLTAILLLASAFSMAGCAFFDDLFAPSDDEDADNKLNSFVECLQNEDGDGIKALFAQNKIANLSDFDESNVGIEAFYILKADDDPNYPQYTYRGDGAWTPGINIGKTHEVL